MCVVTTSAVGEGNAEVREARTRKIPVIQRAEMLAELMRLKFGIAVAGMHGKTTTTSMVAAVLAGGGLDPTVVVGGRVDALGSNARLGNSKYMVAEADESDRSFLKLSPVLGIVTNLDREHMDCYRDMADVEGAFLQFMDGMPFYGATTACVDDPLLRGLLGRVRRKGVHVRRERGCGLPGGAGGSAGGVSMRGFRVLYGGQEVGCFGLRVPGRHNVLNATAAVAVGVQLGVAPEQIAAGLQSFRGVDRRFQVRGVARGVTVVDDYGHHPTEVRATLSAARECGYRRVLVLFQPHRYTRTRDLMEEFAGAFADADAVEVLDIYAASEDPIAGVTGQALAGRIRGAEVGYAGSMEEGGLAAGGPGEGGRCGADDGGGQYFGGGWVGAGGVAAGMMGGLFERGREGKCNGKCRFPFGNDNHGEQQWRYMRGVPSGKTGKEADAGSPSGMTNKW